MKTCLLSSITIAFAVVAALPARLQGSDEWEVLEDVEGRSLECRILGVEGGMVTFIRKSDRLRFDIELAKFSPSTIERLQQWQQEEMEREETAAAGGISKALYPRSRDEIEDVLREIERRDKPSDIDSDQHKTITELNIYRYLCGVPYEVEADPKIVEHATEAAEACEKAGTLSHSLGSYTDKCNISTVGDITRTPQQYINDAGANNREARGHRRWCLNPPMAVTGFGSAGNRYSAMWAMDSGGSRAREPWSYPGRGFFPADRVHGTAWSLYLTGKAPPKGDLTVEVHKLSSRPEQPFPWSEDVPGRALPVPYVSTYLNAINFEPDSKPVNERGIYHVRIEGGGVREQYLVELY